MALADPTLTQGLGSGVGVAPARDTYQKLGGSGAPGFWIRAPLRPGGKGHEGVARQK